MNRGKEQRKRQSEAIGRPEWAEPLAEGDWVPLVGGLALAIGGVFFVTGCIHIYLRLVG